MPGPGDRPEPALTAQVSLVMTDVVGSTRLWEALPAAMNTAMRRHHQLVHGAVAAQEGWLPRDQGEGDAVLAVFTTAGQAVRAAAELQRLLAAEPWPDGVALRVRVGVHAGDVLIRDGNVFGTTVNRCARLRGLGHGGQTLLSAPTYELARDALPAGASVRSLGVHRMKDLSRPEEVFQLALAGLPNDFGPLAGMEQAAHNLPVQMTSFAGRDREVARLSELVQRERLVTVVGFGGMGKTRLALQVAAGLADSSDDGVWLVDLSAVTDSSLVASEINRVLGVAEGADGPEAELIEHLRRKRMLIVLDNVEQVLGCAPFLARLLLEAPDVRVLATSREPLRLRAECQFPLDSLDADAAVELFASRATAVRPGFDLGADLNGRDTAAAICTRLDGLPLAIELAAARVKVLSMGALLTRLDTSLNSVLTGGNRDQPARHQTLRATIAWSYDALSTAEQRLMDRLSIFPGSMTLAAIEEVCADEPDDDYPDPLTDFELLDAVMSLVDKSLLRAIEPAPSAGTTPEPRYVQLVTVREYAASRWADHARERLARRHFERYAPMLSWRLVMPPPPNRRDYLPLITEELHNLRSALRWAQGLESIEEERSLSWLHDVLFDLDLISEARTAGEHFVSRGVNPSPERIMVEASLISLAQDSIGFAGLSPRMEALVAAARSIGEPSLLAYVLTQRVDTDLLMGPAELLTTVEEIEAVLAGVGEGSYLHPARSRFYLDDATCKRAQFVAPDRALAAVARCQGLDYPSFFKTLRLHLLVNRGRLDEAAEAIAQPLPAGTAETEWERGHFAHQLGRYHLDRGDLEEARRQFDIAAECLSSEGRAFHGLQLNLDLAELLHAGGETAAAEGLMRELLPAMDEAAIWEAWVGLAFLQSRLGQPERAGTQLATGMPALLRQQTKSLPYALAGLVIAAELVLETDAPRAARLLALVEHCRLDFRLPFNLGGRASELAARLGHTDLWDAALAWVPIASEARFILPAVLEPELTP